MRAAYGWHSLEEVHIHVHYHCIHVHYHCIQHISRGIYVKGTLYSPDAGHSGREEPAEWLDLARGVTIAAVHNIPLYSTDECGSEQLVKLMWPLATPPSC